MKGNASENKSYRIGVLSDTHGLLRPEVVENLRNTDHIIHAGDFDSPEVLTALEEIAPLSAVRGNMDYGKWTNHLLAADMVQLYSKTFYILHNIYQLDLDPETAGVDVVICGHTHRPAIRRKGPVLYLNPGSAGHRRRDYPVSMGQLLIKDHEITAEIVIIEP